MIAVEGIGKRFRLYSRPSDRLWEILFRRPRHSVHQALDDVSFRVPDGETLGIIGPNGAGKSTLLKILMGILLPDVGTVESSGRITGLLELGTGFNFEMTGLENIAMNGLLLGMSREEIRRRRDAIVAFSELDTFIGEPLKTYSSGMVMRLAFSIAIHASPSCFVVDEALAVGDAHFSQKCMTAIRSFRAGGGSILFVSHDLNAVKILCDQAVLLHRGRVAASGDPESVVNAYNHLVALMSDKTAQDAVRNAGKKTSYGTMELEIVSVEVIGRDSRADVAASGETADITVRFLAHKDVPDPVVGILIRDRFGQDIFGTNTYHHGIKLAAEAGGRYACTFTLPLAIAPGRYTVTAALHTGPAHSEHCYHWRDSAAEFTVAGIRGRIFTGIASLEAAITLSPYQGGRQQ